MTPDEVGRMDNAYALLFIRGERPIMDKKFDILRHTNVALTTDGKAEPYRHGEDTRSRAVISFTTDKEIVKIAPELEETKTDYIFLADDELEELIKNMEVNFDEENE